MHAIPLSLAPMFPDNKGLNSKIYKSLKNYIWVELTPLNCRHIYQFSQKSINEVQ